MDCVAHVLKRAVPAFVQAPEKNEPNLATSGDAARKVPAPQFTQTLLTDCAQF
jgi:hypothetical protein